MLSWNASAVWAGFGWGMALAAAAVGPQAAAGEDFRIESKVFSDSRKEPTSASIMIVHDGVAYDFMREPEEAIVFEKAAGRFVLLDVRRRVRAELTTTEVAAFTERLKKSAESQQDPFIKFLAAPQFDERYNETTGELVLSSPWLTYRILARRAESGAISEQYREFSDWLARLNTLLNPGSRPPAARLLVDEALAKRGLVPSEIHLTLSPKKGVPAKHTTIRSEHRFTRPLAEADLNQVKQARQHVDSFKQVTFAEYRKRTDR